MTTALKSLQTLAAALICAASFSAFAADTTEPKHPEGKPHTPPPEAIAACKSLAEKNTCTFTGRNSETVTGVCSKPHEGAEITGLVCRPEHHKHDGMEPPKDK